jgi:hypothetical protein
MLRHVAAAPVLLAGMYLVVLALAALVAPTRATRFLRSFASTPAAHATELLLRLVTGAGLILHGPRMLLPSLFSAVGWVLVVTTAFMIILPWRWHRRFAQWSVPYATQRLMLLGAGSLIGGIALLAAVIIPFV